MPRSKPRTTARAIVVRDHHLLLVERWRQGEGGQELHYFSIPGGAIEAGETPERAVVREIFEEASIVVRPQQLLTQFCEQNGDAHTYFVCQYLSGEPKIHPGSPEAARAHDHNRYKPQWVSAAQFAHVPLHAIYEPLRYRITEMLY